MSTLYAMKAGETDWTQQHRVDSEVGVPLTFTGAAAAREIAAELAGRRIAAVYSSPNESDRQTAEIAAETLDVPHRLHADLQELSYGLWQGLAEEEIRRRQPRVYRQWQDDPVTVCPPEGETMGQAQERIVQAVRKAVRRYRGQNVLVVLHPLAWGLLRCRLLGVDLARVWEQVQWPGAWASYDLEQLPHARELV